MCFSAGASFAASAVLGATGTATITKSKTRGERMLAAIPLLFAVQQFIEGVQWIADKPSDLSTLLGYFYLVFAFLLWPIYLPLTSYKLEKTAKNKKAISIFVGAGVATSLFLLYLLVTKTLSIEVESHHIVYNLNLSYLVIGYTVYTLVLFGGLIFSSSKIIKYLGVLLIVSSALSAYFSFETFTSTWCFFAALLSPIILLFFLKKNR